MIGGPRELTVAGGASGPRSRAPQNHLPISTANIIPLRDRPASNSTVDYVSLMTYIFIHVLCLHVFYFSSIVTLHTGP